MNVHSIPTTIRVQPGQPVELSFTIDGETVLAGLEWPVIERWLGDTRANDAEAVREAIHQRRHLIERAVQARVYAHGVPLSGELTLGIVDFPARR